jgi:hypothetical protein
MVTEAGLSIKPHCKDPFAGNSLKKVAFYLLVQAGFAH